MDVRAHRFAASLGPYLLCLWAVGVACGSEVSQSRPATQAAWDSVEFWVDSLDDRSPEGWAKAYMQHGWGHEQRGADPLTVKIKAALAERLASKNDPKAAWALAVVIQNQLAGTELQWAAPCNSSSFRHMRGDPGEGYGHLGTVLESGLAAAKPDDELREPLGICLAKLRLVQGDWEGMNRVLRQIGYATIDPKRRPFLSAPPVAWAKSLSEDWKECDEEWRSGDCSLVFRIQKGGKGLAGCHVLLKATPPKDNMFTTGIRADTLFLSPWPVPLWPGLHGESFGYLAGKRGQTRYAVSGPSGEVRFDKLPVREVSVEVLVPAGIFSERGYAWDLYMETEPGEFQVAQMYGADHLDPNQPPAVFELKAGQVVRYPLLVVRPQLHLNVANWAEGERQEFVASWEDSTPGERPEGYELQLAPIGPPETPTQADFSNPIDLATQAVTGTSWPIGEKGVGSLRLAPGGMYIMRVVARDAEGRMTARSAFCFIWVPWEHRTSKPPSQEHGSRDQPPIHHETYFRGSFQEGTGEPVTLQQRVSEWLAANPLAFEREYVMVGKAWLEWFHGDRNAACEELAKLARGLPGGSVPQATAAWLVAEDEAGRNFPKRLEFKLPALAAGAKRE